METTHLLMLGTGTCKVRCGKRIHAQLDENGQTIYSLKFSFYKEHVDCLECLEYSKSDKAKHEDRVQNLFLTNTITI